MFDLLAKQDIRPPKHGWWKGDYIGHCRNCNEQFIGAKGAYMCSDCAYDFDEQLMYEQLWRNYAWPYTARYITKKLWASHKE